jgi:Fe-S-cluster-containing dehydrogenase component
MSEYGLLIDYEYCTGCHSCEVACKQEYKIQAGKWGGIKVIEMIQELPGDALYITYVPVPTKLCILCIPRVKKGLPPACVKHCMAGCMKFGRVEELSKEMLKKRKMVLWVP